MEENRLSSGVIVEVVRASVEEHLVYLNARVKRTQELIRFPLALDKLLDCVVTFKTSADKKLNPFLKIKF